MVVSDLSRAGTAHEVLEDIKKSVTPAEGLFMDTIVYTQPSGMTAFVSEQLSAYRLGRYVNFKEEGIGDMMKAEMERELAAMSRESQIDPSTEFSMNAIPVQF